MNILFLMKVFDVGGQEVVTAVLANCFAEHNHQITIASFKEPSPMMVERVDKRVDVCTIGKFSYSKNNIDTLRQILINKKIDVVINQWGLPYVPAKVLTKAKKGLNVRTITIYHNSPDTNARIKDKEIALSRVRDLLKRIALQAGKKIVKFITSQSMRYVYNRSDYYMVLSPSYVEKFKAFTRLKNPSKLLVQTNPVTIDSSDFELDFTQKQKEIIYVGRVDYNQKRVYRVIETWSLLEDNFSDWKLTIVGDGVERKNIEKQVKELKLKHVSFVGFQEPKDYYKRASILILTSEYEGFPLVLTEAMSFGVVPAVYGSYSAVYDIITDEVDGIISPYQENGYKASEMAGRLSVVMEQPELYQKMAIAAKRKSEEFSLDIIYQSWKNIFNEIQNANPIS